MAAAAQTPSSGQVEKMLRRAARNQISTTIRKPHHAVRVADIDPVGMRSCGIEIDAKGQIQPGSKHRNLPGRSIRLHPTKDLDLAGFHLRQKDIAVGRGADQPGYLSSLVA